MDLQSQSYQRMMKKSTFCIQAISYIGPRHRQIQGDLLLLISVQRRQDSHLLVKKARVFAIAIITTRFQLSSTNLETRKVVTCGPLVQGIDSLVPKDEGMAWDDVKMAKDCI